MGLTRGGSVVADRAVYRGTDKGSGGCCDRVAGLYDGVQGQGGGAWSWRGGTGLAVERGAAEGPSLLIDG